MFTRTDIQPFNHKIWLASPTLHEEELKYINEAFDKNWVTTSGENITRLEQNVSAYLEEGMEKKNYKKWYTVGLGTGTAAIHLALKLAGTKTNLATKLTDGLLKSHKVFVSDLTFNATVNPIVYEGGTPIFIDSEYETWNMDPDALSRAFELYPDVRIVVVTNLYGVPAQLKKIRSICAEHKAVLIEDAAESLGAYIISKDKAGKKRIQQTGTFGDYNIISFNGNKIITGSSGGMMITADKSAAEKVRKWSTQSREAAPWYQHEELGYNYRISNIVAGIARGQFEHLDEHIEQKKKIYERYKNGLKGLPVSLNPFLPDSVPNYWLSCMLVDQPAMCRQVRSEKDALYKPEHGKTCPTEILEALEKVNAEGRPIWKPIHLQPLYRSYGFVTAEGNGRARTDAYIAHKNRVVDEDVFERGLCLPSDIKMRYEEQEKIIEIIKSCFD